MANGSATQPPTSCLAFQQAALWQPATHNNLRFRVTSGFR